MRPGANWFALFGSFALFGLCATVLVGCGPEVVYEARHELPGSWTYADSADFRYEIGDTSRGYDLALTLEHTDAFATQNLYARFVTTYPSGGREVQDVSLELADRFGNWLGECRGEACVLTIPLQRGARYPAPGNYGLTLLQHGRTEQLPGLEAVGLAVTVAD